MRPLDAARPVDAVRPVNAARPVDTARTRGCRETHGYHETRRCCRDWRCRKSSPPSPTPLPQLDGDAPEQDDLGPHNPGPDLNGDPNLDTEPNLNPDDNFFQLISKTQMSYVAMKFVIILIIES